MNISILGVKFRTGKMIHLPFRAINTLKSSTPLSQSTQTESTASVNSFRTEQKKTAQNGFMTFQHFPTPFPLRFMFEIDNN